MGEWKKIRFGDLYAIPSRNGVSKPSRVRGAGYKMINMGELFAHDWIFDIPMELVPLTDSEKANSQVVVDDLLFARQSMVASGAGRCVIVREVNELTVFESHLIRVRLDQAKALPLFYYYYFRSGCSNIASIVQHVVQAGIRASDLSDLEVDLPDLPTQRRIAAVLGALDDKIEVNRKICENLEAQAQALFKGMKRRAEESSFVQVIDILSGGTPKTSVPEYWNGDIPFFSPKDVGGLFTISTERNITDQGLANCNSILYPKGTTFVTARGTVGKVCLAGVPMAMNQSCFALASNEIDPLLVYFYTCASVDSLKSKANGSVFAAITIAEFETEKIHRLTDSEEERFVKTIRPMFDQILVRQQESRALAAMRDALLPKLMSGELSVEKVEG